MLVQFKSKTAKIIVMDHACQHLLALLAALVISPCGMQIKFVRVKGEVNVGIWKCWLAVRIMRSFAPRCIKGSKIKWIAIHTFIIIMI